MEERARPNLWRRIAQLQFISLCVSGAAALLLNLVMIVTDLILQITLYGTSHPKADLFLWPILFAASPMLVLHATQQCFRFVRAAAFVACGILIAGLLGLGCGLVEQTLAGTPLSTPMVAAILSAAGYALIGVIGILVTAWIVEDEAAPPIRTRRRRTLS